MKEQMHIIKGGKAISVSLDTLAKAAYITYSDKPIAKTVKKSSHLYADYDKKDNLVGIEIIRLKKAHFTFKKILESQLPNRINKQVKELLQSA